ncbi:methyl-accepting chemotaxis protein [Aquabacterium sp. CECT 9606]|uniref:methyl-accepting chemotaxis protein n=1 Tax=Aquabacterium sp. CECT 9606 TaxID=2845822 RepID=UPI001E4F9C8C|nr:methyl-accepting chemotaxis protein [Aquabacterium sp. CECT 9606]CAH0351018.1 Methyl-accepting chemotaxis protein II [Aquabacterium sp. CECT 9606]
MKLSIQQKLLGFSLTGLILMVLIGITGYSAVYKLSSDNAKIATIGSALRAQMQADMMHDALRADVLSAMLASLNKDEAEEKNTKAALAEHIESFRDSFKTLDELALDAEIMSASARVRPALTAYLASATEVINLAFTDRDAAQAKLPAFKDAFESLEKSMGNLGDLIESQAKTAQAASDKTATIARAVMVVTALIAGALFFVMGHVVSRGVVLPIGRAVKVAQAVANGDLTSHIDTSGSDETAQLLKALKAMNDSLILTVGTVRQSSENIATGSSQIAIGNTDLSHRTETQASNLQQTAASMEELSSTVRHNADTARQASQLASSASDVAAKGGSVVAQVVGTMAEITTASRKINDIIGVIDGIAFQTNILALNAAVEAARAGEQGRGFAVVASEVRSLAQRSANAAKEIKGLINDSVEKVQTGSRLVDDAGQTMDDIVAQVRRVTDLIGEISSATHEQTSGIELVSGAVAQLDQVTQQNAALVEESAAAAESLKHQAAELVKAVSVFQLNRA